MKKLIFVSVMLFCATIAFAQEQAAADTAKVPSYWKISGKTNLNLTQSSYNNWASGGENTIAGTLGGDLYISYLKEKTSWENSLILGYGLSYQGSKRSKTNDKIDFKSKFGYKAFGKVNYTASFHFNSQLDKGYPKYPVEKGDPYSSKFMAPAYSELGIGFDYKPRPEFSFEFSPIGGKLTFVSDDSLSKQGVFGVKPGQHSYYEFGARFTATCKDFKIKDNIILNSTFRLFSNLLHNPENIDVNWDFNLNFKITKYISSFIDLELRYDDDIKNNKTGTGPAVQFKQILSIGFSYNF